MLPLATHAHGAYVYDADGRDYLDGCSGAVNVNLGHGVREVTDRMHEQIDRICFAYRTQFRSEPLTRLTRHLAELAPGDLRHVQFCNSGSEAIEMALRLAMIMSSRQRDRSASLVLTEEPSYHGMTAGALGASGHPLRRRQLAPLLANQATVTRVRPGPGSLRPTTQDWERAISEAGGPASLAAVLIEPVGGASSGAVPASWDALRRLRELADEHGFLLIADEVMSGMGRTGRWFGCEHADVVPDVLVLGKGISAGYAAISAIVVTEQVARRLGQPLDSLLFGHTMAGSPLAAATALAVVEYLRERDVPGRAARSGERLGRVLAGLSQRHRMVTGERGVGLQRALGLRPVPERFPGVSTDLVRAARDAGLLVYPAGISARYEAVMIAPPLTITDDDLAELARRLDRALTAIACPPERQQP
jgi:hypothetical protein